MFRVTVITICAMTLLQGCSGSSVKQHSPADVTSNPSGATVYANQLKLGVTPLHYKLYKAFPAGWSDAMYQAQGVLIVKMDDCEDYTLKVNDYILSKPVHAELECSEPGSSEVSTTAVEKNATSNIMPVVTPASETEKRLEQLESIYDKGMITDEEYRATRERILNEL